MGFSCDSVCDNPWWTLCCHYYATSSHSVRFMSWQWQHSYNLSVAATTTSLATAHIHNGNTCFLILIVSWWKLVLAYILICNMPRFTDFRDHHSAIQQDRGLFLVPRRGWRFSFNGTHFPYTFLQLDFSLCNQCYQRRWMLVPYSLYFAMVLGIIFSTVSMWQKEISRICSNLVLVQLELHWLGCQTQLQLWNCRKTLAFNFANFECLSLCCWWLFLVFFTKIFFV